MSDDAFHADPRNWTRGPIKLYFARADRRFWVPRYRPAFGWTINFAHPLAPAAIVGVLVAPFVTSLAIWLTR